MDSEKIILIILGILLVVGFILMMILLNYIKNKHPKTWHALGEPSFFYNNSLKNNISMMKFLWRKEYLKIGDSTLKRISLITQFYTIFYTALLIGLLIYLVFFSQKSFKF